MLLVALFAALALLTRLVCLDPQGSTALWPANGALVVAWLLLPPRKCLAVLLVCLGLNMALNMLTEYTLFESVLYSMMNIVGSYFVAIATRHTCGARTDLSRLRRLANFGMIAFASAALESAIGEVLAAGGKSWAELVNDWLQWALCDGFGFLLATPAILLFASNLHNSYRCEASPLERWLLLAMTAVLTSVSFMFAHSPFFLLIYPMLILTAFRAGPAWVLASILITAMISSGLTAHADGPLAAMSTGKILFGQDILQPFLISIFLAAVPANNALGEKARSARRLLQMKATIEHSATHDTLTTLVNRDLFRRRLGAMLRGRLRCAVLFVDLDRFKHVNDTMGHAAGDELLRAFSGRIREVAGNDATVARFGGDEFAILVPCEEPQTDPEKLCGRICEVARQPFSLGAGPAHVSASIGVAIAAGGLTEASDLMRKADIALYAVKAAGRDGYRLFSEDLDRSTSERAEIEADLRSAIEMGHLELHYQAKVDVQGKVKGVEALLRWRHPGKGFIAPAAFIPVAEETGLIIPMGEWILREALGFAARWPDLDVAINVSPVQLRNPSFVASTLAAFHAAKMPYGRLELEVTETALIHDLNVVNGALATLRAAGIRIALDDFGTGYSSLRHLHRCAVDRVKIDQSFVQALGGGSEAEAIINAVIQLGHAMGLAVTAEGVETEAQRRFLVDAGVDEMQGYLFARPVNEAGLADAMRPDVPDEKQGKVFFFEKKKQKTFMSSDGCRG